MLCETNGDRLASRPAPVSVGSAHGWVPKQWRGDECRGEGEAGGGDEGAVTQRTLQVGGVGGDLRALWSGYAVGRVTRLVGLRVWSDEVLLAGCLFGVALRDLNAEGLGQCDLLGVVAGERGR